MQKRKKCKFHVKRKTQFEHKANHLTSWKIIALAVYLTFILLSTIAFTADRSVVPNMKSSYEYHLTYKKDGLQSHYYVEREDTSEPGRIDLVYKTASNTLDVDVQNIKVLHIYCRSMYEDECKKVYGFDPKDDSNYYKWYFIEKYHFNVKVDTEHLIKELKFIDTPIPYNVSVNGQEWWLTGINYTYKNDGIVLTKVPQGHSNVDIYFKSNNLNAPVALFTTSKTVVGIGETITFNASQSYDPDGVISSYVWDLGEGTFKIGEKTTHSFAQEGNYKVILTVKDNNYLVDHAFKDITVVNKVMSISKSVDKPIATPGSILTYTLTPTMNTSWQEGVKDLIVTDILPNELEYIDSTPKPSISDKTITWNLGKAINNNELTSVILQAEIKKDVENETVITNYASLDYKGTSGQTFPQELTSLVSTKVNVGSILAPRILRTVPNVELSEDAPPYAMFLSPYEHDLQDSGTDLRWYITGENESLYILSGENSDNDILTISPLPNAFGNDLVTLWLIDSEEFTANQLLWINITPVNDNPVFSKAPDIIIHYSEPYTFDYSPYIEDIDTPSEILKLFTSENLETSQGKRASTPPVGGGTSNEYIQVNGFKVTYTYPVSYVGKHVLVTLIVFDGNGSASDTIQINIKDDYTPQLKQDLPDIWLDEGETKENVFDLDDYFEDPDKDSLFYSFGETHVTVRIDDDHSVDISSPTDWNGVDKVTFRARDPVGAIAEDTIFVTVSPINDPPVIAGVPETFIVHYEADYCFDLTPYISDEDNSYDELFLILSDKYIRTDPLNQLKIIMNYPEEMLGMEIPVRLIVSDGEDTDFADVIIKVTNIWPPEIVTELPDVSFYEDSKLQSVFNLNDFFDDKDSETLYYSYGQEFVNVTINSDGTVDFTAYPNWHGVEVVTFRATDPTSAFVECIIKVTVIPVNDPPIIRSIPTLQGMVKQLWKFDLTEYLDDIDNELTDLEITVESKVLEIMVNGMELVIYSNKPGIEEVNIIVSDGHAETQETISIEILPDKSKSGTGNENLMTILWILTLFVIIIISIMGYTTYRRYAGNYEIEEIFWVYESGILISHVNAKVIKYQADKDIVSGMLTAILDFSEDAFAKVEELNDKSGRIKEIQMDEKNILVDRGKYTFLATVISGKSGKKLYSMSRRTLQSLENKYGENLRNWKGDRITIAGSNIILEGMLPSENKNSFIYKQGK
jgi:uncharacterized repeat protein (TIGR01451 family)